MINEHSLKAIEGGLFQKGFCRPLYNSYCFSRIPASIRYLLTGKGKELALPHDVFGKHREPCDIVLLVLLDGFGWRFFEHYRTQYPFLRWFEEEGVVSKITSQFPSTTAAHVTCLHTGLEVGVSGVYEWFYYEPLVDRVIAPLLTSFAGDKELSTLEATGIDLATLYPKTTIYQNFKKEGIHSFVFQPINIAHSSFSQAMCKEAIYMPYHHISEGLDRVVELINTLPRGEKHYLYLYFSEIDSAGHRSGLFSHEYEQTVVQTMAQLEQRLHEKVQKINRNASLIVTADHGMIEIDPKKTIYLNFQFPELLPMLKKNHLGFPIVPAGSCRDFFLHIEEPFLEEASKLLQKGLRDRAWVVKTSELLEQGFFGEKTPSSEFLERVGNLVVLSYEHESIWWYEKNRFDQHFLAMHGGLTTEEMETIFLFAKF